MLRDRIMSDRFWETKSLIEMSPEEWESLCDGCGKCCLHKLQDADTGELFYTNVACRLLNLQTARCARYAQRARLMPDCIQLSAERVGEFDWLPRSCAYRLLAEGKDLPDWHPLVSGDPRAAQRVGASVRGWAVPEKQARNLEDYVIGKAL